MNKTYLTYHKKLHNDEVEGRGQRIRKLDADKLKKKEKEDEVNIEPVHFNL